MAGNASDDLSATLKWWVEHANIMEQDRNRMKKKLDVAIRILNDIMNSYCCDDPSCEDCHGFRHRMGEING